MILASAFSIYAQRNVEKGDRYFNQNQFEQAIKYYLMDANSKIVKLPISLYQN